jgi:hypothetical protein
MKDLYKLLIIFLIVLILGSLAVNSYEPQPYREGAKGDSNVDDSTCEEGDEECKQRELENSEKN